MREAEEGEVTEDTPQKKTNTDIRDSQKIATLPNDLRDIANQMLEEKFGLSSQGEVVKKNPKAKRGASYTVLGESITSPEVVSPSKRDTFIDPGEMMNISMEEDKYRR